MTSAAGVGPPGTPHKPTRGRGRTGGNTTAEQRFKRAVVVLWHKGIYPGPTALNERLSGRQSRHLGGCRPRWRREVFAEMGIPLQRPNTYPARGVGGSVLR